MSLKAHCPFFPPTKQITWLSPKTRDQEAHSAFVVMRLQNPVTKATIQGGGVSGIHMSTVSFETVTITTQQLTLSSIYYGPGALLHILYVFCPHSKLMRWEVPFFPSRLRKRRYGEESKGLCPSPFPPRAFARFPLCLVGLVWRPLAVI